MSVRSLGSRLAVGSALWTVGLLLLAAVVTTTVIGHWPQLAGALHWANIGFYAAVLMTAGFTVLMRSLSPFERLRRALLAVREGQTTAVDGDYPAEVQPLVDELNALLAHQAISVERAVTRAADLAHGLKTPLALLAQEAEAAEADTNAGLAARLRQHVARMQHHIDVHLARARAADAARSHARTAVAPAVEGLVRTVSRLYAHRDLSYDVSSPPNAVVRVERRDLDEMLGNLIDNACKWARGRVAVSWTRTGGRIVIAVDDDGAGIPAAERARVLRRGVRLDEVVPGDGLGLAIAADLAEIYGGTLTLGDSPLGGLRAELSLDAADPAMASSPSA